MVWHPSFCRATPSWGVQGIARGVPETVRGRVGLPLPPCVEAGALAAGMRLATPPSAARMALPARNMAASRRAAASSGGSSGSRPGRRAALSAWARVSSVMATSSPDRAGRCTRAKRSTSAGANLGCGTGAAADSAARQPVVAGRASRLRRTPGAGRSRLVPSDPSAVASHRRCRSSVAASRTAGKGSGRIGRRLRGNSSLGRRRRRVLPAPCGLRRRPGKSCPVAGIFDRTARR